MHPLISKKSGERLFLLGNEAVVRGAIEGGVAVTATYPGTPSSEIGDTFYEIYKELGIYFEFSVNEKVALEVAASGSVSGLRSFVWFKHVGLNVASDSFMSLAYTDIRGGLVVLSADDPSMFSSQNEQDNRHYARLGNVVLIEPSTPQEMKDLMPYAFMVSEKVRLPILFRTTTRVAHMRGVVELGDIFTNFPQGEFIRDPAKLVPVPSNAYRSKGEIIEKLKKAEYIANESVFNKLIEVDGKIDTGLLIIVSGVSFNYIMDALAERNLKAMVLKLTLTYPFPEKLVMEAMKNKEKILVVEEVDPIMEKEIYYILGRYGLNKKVYGKLDGTLPIAYEYNQDIIESALEHILGVNFERPKPLKTELPLAVRPPVFCPGCPHRGMYDAVKRAVNELGIDAIYPNDIGCYTLSINAPFNMADYLLSMGSSVGTASGLSKFSGKKVIAFIGDSTFFHAGIPALVNAVHNKDNFTLVILDNRTTAMTGAQPNPGLDEEGKRKIDIESVVKGIGVDYVKTVDPYNLKMSTEAVKEALNTEGVSVVISKRECALIVPKKKYTFVVDLEKCTGCMNCINEIACPAMYVTEDHKVQIDEFLCDGCAVCVQTCPEKAIKVRKI
ncbi:MAG: indolepyruvate ferredoxin oxidoreductase subunit alpha [Caldisericum sp.]|uniref:indolepyruvate ferredoxin oxidoreductase subunit alpha n=1 Tax=Caldisericum sp. TaxID=2499687 RepID=UPI003D0B0FF0